VQEVEASKQATFKGVRLALPLTLAVPVIHRRTDRIITLEY